jgi:hypothetical protein
MQLYSEKSHYNCLFSDVCGYLPFGVGLAHPAEKHSGYGVFAVVQHFFAA